jgi:hypothetical protein
LRKEKKLRSEGKMLELLTSRDAVLAYRARGFSVIPIKPKEKKPIVAWEPYQKEPASEATIQHWFESWPNANVGIVTGAVSGLVVIDVDTPETKDKLRELVPGFDFTAVPRSRTGKGWQLFFQHPGVSTPNRAGIVPGLDVRGDGGYVVAPPSIHPNGKQYRWELALNGELPKLPVTLFQLIATPAGIVETGYRERFSTAQALAGVPQGQRDETLFKLACKLRHADVPKDMAEALIVEASRNCEPPFSEMVAIEKVRRAYRRYDPKAEDQKNTDNGKSSPWACVQDAPTFLAEKEKEFKGIAKDLLAPAAVTMIAAPRGLGKTHVAEAAAVALACGGVFRNEQVDQLRVLLLDRDNPRSEVKKR